MISRNGESGKAEPVLERLSRSGAEVGGSGSHKIRNEAGVNDLTHLMSHPAADEVTSDYDCSTPKFGNPTLFNLYLIFYISTLSMFLGYRTCSNIHHAAEIHTVHNSERFKLRLQAAQTGNAVNYEEELSDFEFAKDS
jgi:hypothetical protein